MKLMDVLIKNRKMAETCRKYNKIEKFTKPFFLIFLRFNSI